MSYLNYCTKHKPATNGRGDALESNAHHFKVKWRGDAGQLCVNPLGGVIIYKRHSRLGERIYKDHESEKHFIVKAIRENGGEWDRDYTWHAS